MTSVFLVLIMGVITPASLGDYKDEKITYISHYCNAWHIVGATEKVATKTLFFPFSSLLGQGNYREMEEDR